MSGVRSTSILSDTCNLVFIIWYLCVIPFCACVCVLDLDMEQDRHMEKDMEKDRHMEKVRHVE